MDKVKTERGAAIHHISSQAFEWRLVLFCLLTSNMPTVTPEDKAFIVSQYYAGKTAMQIKRKLERDRKRSFSLSTISRWFKRVPEQFETECHMKRKVRRA